MVECPLRCQRTYALYARAYTRAYALATAKNTPGRDQLLYADNTLWPWPVDSRTEDSSMIELTGAQLRFAASMLFGWRFSGRSLDRIIEGMLATRREFGSIAANGAELLSGP